MTPSNAASLTKSELVTCLELHPLASGQRSPLECATYYLSSLEPIGVNRLKPNQQPVERSVRPRFEDRVVIT